jgi:predicted metal-dependent HD superfamily phosphohydrolase
MGVPEHLIILIKKKTLYTKQEAAVRTEYGNTEWFEVRKGVRRGCILSPYLFNMYSEYILRKVGF